MGFLLLFGVDARPPHDGVRRMERFNLLRALAAARGRICGHYELTPPIGDHRAIKRTMRPMLGFKSMHCARLLLAGIETMHMVRKGQLGGPKGKVAFAAEQFYSLAF
jgi:hypothetical protein